MKNWEYVTLDQLGDVSRGRSKHRPRNDASLFGGDYPFIQTADVKDAPFYITSYSDTYNEKGLSQSKLWNKGTLCITIAANIADTAILGIDACFPDSVMGFIPHKGVSNVRFVKYAFDMLQKDMRQISQGTAQDNLSWQKLSTIKFPKPPIDIQERIADVMAAYEDLIENNRKQIKLLEEAAQRLYKEWFIDLRFPGHEDSKIINGIPGGWRQTTLSEIAVVNKQSIGKDYPYETIKYIDLGSVSNGHILEKNEYLLQDAPGRARRLAKDGDVIWGMVRPNLRAFALIQNPTSDSVFSTGFAVLSATSVPFSFLYCLTTTDEFVGYLVGCTNGAAYPAVKPSHFEAARIIVPNNSLLTLFHQKTEPIFRKIGTLDEMNTNLMEARDRLLPKLMSGEIEL